MEAKIEAILENDINPKLLEHHGWVELQEVEDDVVYVRFRGACSGCDANFETLETIVKPKLMEKLPEVKEVYRSEEVSEILFDIAKDILGKSKKS